MTNEEKNIAVAEWCGWTDVHLCRIDCELDPEPIGIPSHLKEATHATKRSDIGYDGTKYHSIPNFGSDLNAMNEAEVKLSDEQAKRYAYEISLFIIPGRDHTKTGSMYIAIHAPAQTRREALLKTLGLWKD